jgi:hypothetical protein
MIGHFQVGEVCGLRIQAGIGLVLLFAALFLSDFGVIFGVLWNIYNV